MPNILTKNKARLLVNLVLTFFAVFAYAPPAALAYTFTPGITAKLGYDTNVRLTRNAREDGFFRIAPSFKFKGGRPARLFEASGDIIYVQYFTLGEETGLDGGSLNLLYHHEASPNWKWDFQNRFRSTYDSAEVDETGNLIRVRDRSGRLDRNTTGVYVEHSYGPSSNLMAGYDLAINRRTDDAISDSMIHHGQLQWDHRINPDWRTLFEGHYYFDDYDTTPDQNRGQVLAGLGYMMGPTREAFMVLGYQQVAAISDDPLITQARDYEVYSASLGYKHAVSPTFEWNIRLGASKAEGDTQANEASGEYFPTGRLEATWRGKVWLFNIYAGADLGEYDLLGENSGLNYSQRVGASYSYDFTQHWSLSLRANYTRDNYQQDPALADTTTPQGDVDSILLGAVLDYRITRHIKLGLDYRFLDRDSTINNDDRNQNQIMLVLSAENPYRW